jgi:hypothetical protein
MKYDIKTDQDEFFNLVENSKEPEVVQEIFPEIIKPGKIPAPLNNPSGISWFDGTSWGTKR